MQHAISMVQQRSCSHECHTCSQKRTKVQAQNWRPRATLFNHVKNILCTTHLLPTKLLKGCPSLQCACRSHNHYARWNSPSRLRPTLTNRSCLNWPIHSALIVTSCPNQAHDPICYMSPWCKNTSNILQVVMGLPRSFISECSSVRLKLRLGPKEMRIHTKRGSMFKL